MNQQSGKVSWPGARGLYLTDELPVVHTSMLGIDMLIDEKFHLDLMDLVPTD